MGRLENLYSTRCPVCGGIKLPNLADAGPFDAILDDIAEKLFKQQLSEGKISDALYQQTADRLLKAMHEGLGGVTFGYEDPRNSLKAYLEQNIYAFSAAKSVAELEHLRSLMIDETGKLRTFTEFRNAVMDAGYQFNVNWLHTEYNTVVASAQNAVLWNKYLENGTKVLQFTTQRDNRVRDEHAILDGLTFRIEDPILRTFWPPLDFNCRCFFIPGIESQIGQLEERLNMSKAQIIRNADISKLFRNNSGIQKLIFKTDDTNPYFKILNSFLQEKELTAESNYGMKSVSALYNKFEFEPAFAFGTEIEANAWWQSQSGTLEGSFFERDINGVVVKFDNDFRLKNVKDNSIGNVKTILSKPDEVWSFRVKNKIERYYLKYYKDSPMIVRVIDDNGLKAFSMQTSFAENEIEQFREGNLIFRKR